LTTPKNSPGYARIIVAILLIVTYVLLMPAYIIHGAHDRIGIVSNNVSIELDSLPDPVKSSLYQNSTWTVVFMKHVYPTRTDAIITNQSYPTGTLIEVMGTKSVWITDWHSFNFGEEFDRLVIPDSVTIRTSTGSCPKPVSLEWFITLPSGLRALENCLERNLAQSGEAPYLTLSRIDYLGGPFLITFAALIISRKLMIWSLASALWLYTVQILLSNQLLFMHNTIPDSTLLYLGYLALPFPILIYLIRRWENSPSGRAFLDKALRGL
jgi:hypothetical protein